MLSAMSKKAVLANLQLVADWLAAKHPSKAFELVIVGGAAMALLGMRGTTFDVDVLEPSTLPPELVEGARVVARAKGLGPEWLNDAAARAVRAFGPRKRFPSYFDERAEMIQIAPNLRVSIIGRQALISLKLLAATPTTGKHLQDLRTLNATRQELEVAKKFVLSRDNSEPRRQDLEDILSTLGDADA